MIAVHLAEEISVALPRMTGVAGALRRAEGLLGSIVADLLGCPMTDPRVLPCAGSIQSQLMMTQTNPIAAHLVG